MAFMAVIAMVLGITIADMPPMKVVQEMGPLLVLAAGWLTAPNLLHRFQRWWLARKHGTGDEMELRVFSEDGFVGSSRWSQPVPWFLVERVVETPNYFLVYAAHEGPSYVPKSALQPADVERLGQMLASYSTRTGMSLKPRPGWIPT